MPISAGPQDAVVVVDFQNDFCPGGALAVGEGDAIGPAVAALLALPAGLRIATQDWHPPGHCSFREKGGPWPAHCVQDTPGAQFHPSLDRSRLDLVIRKGTRPDVDAYSGFDGTNLAELLKSKNIRRIILCGLATDYCVKATALDGRRNGFEVVVVEEGCRGVEAKPGDVRRAWEEMRAAGCQIL